MAEPIQSNPLKILEALDKFLHSPFELIVYGRSALALGYTNPPSDFLVTMDVDAILPSKDLQAIEANDDFWEAQEKVNETFADTGLYFTHLFEEKQVILSSGWYDAIVPLNAFGFKWISLKRPSTSDLILTKMMRVDPQDREDMQFLMGQDDFSRTEFNECMKDAVCPNVPEIEDAFKENSEWIKKFA